MARDARRAGRAEGLDRREFLRRGALAGVGLGLLPLETARAALEEGPPRVRRRVRLGRTGLEVPDIGFGTYALRGDEDLVRHALERGITHFDTAESYTDGAAEETLGRALKGVRDRVTITSKYVAQADDSVDKQMRMLEGSLRRLQTDHIDLYLNHAVNDVARLQNPAWMIFVERAKKQGKIRFAGMSGHGSHLTACLDHALRHDLVDVILVAYNFSQDPGLRGRLGALYRDLAARLDFVTTQHDLPELLERASQKGVGVMAMKTLKGARINDMRPYETGGASFAQAAFRWTLSNPQVDALVVTMKSREMVDEYLGASGWERPRAGDLSLLERYERLNGRSQCQYGCGACADACPRGVPISDVLRSRMYDRDYGEPELARQAYAALGAGAAPCLDCADLTCLGTCPSGLSIPDLTRDARRRLDPRA